MNPWEDPHSIWKTKSEYFTWLRGALRRLWSDYPLRKEWKKQSLRPVTQEEKKRKCFHPSTKNVGQCVFCKEWFAGSKLEVDHIKASEGCFDYDTAEQFMWHCGGLTSDKFQLSCKPCHKIKSYAERQNIPFEQAQATKQAIAIQKDRKEESEWFAENNIKPASNAKKRREQIINHLLQE